MGNSAPQYVCACRTDAGLVWDTNIHNYKLTDTAEDEDADEYDKYIFTVRRQFDWKGKYENTVVHIKSEPLKAALVDVMDGVKGVSLVEDTPSVSLLRSINSDFADLALLDRP